MHIEDQTKATRIAALNDEFRKSLSPRLGRVLVTRGVSALGQAAVLAAFAEVKTFNDFIEGNDPYGEHDFGNFELAGQMFFFKIDYYAPDMEHGSEDPSDESNKTRPHDHACGGSTIAAASLLPSAIDDISTVTYVTPGKCQGTSSVKASRLGRPISR